MNVRLRQLRAFVAVARTGSFTEAANRLFLTQSALSGQIKELERVLGVRLFDRTTRQVQVSQIGSEFLPLASRILEDLDRSLDAIAELKALRTGRVRIAAPQLMACTIVPEMIAAFAGRHPDLQISLADAESDLILSKVRSGEVDFGLGTARDDMEDIDSRFLFEMPFVVVFRPGDPLGTRGRVTWNDLNGRSLISLVGQYTQVLNNDLVAAGHKTLLRPDREVSFLTTALSMVRAGLGITLCQPYAHSLIGLHGLQMRQLDAPVIHRKFYVMTRRDRSLSPAAQALLDFLGDFVEGEVFRTVSLYRGPEGR